MNWFNYNFLETSALNGDNISKAFDELIFINNKNIFQDDNENEIDKGVNLNDEKNNNKKKCCLNSQLWIFIISIILILFVFRFIFRKYNYLTILFFSI